MDFVERAGGYNSTTYSNEPKIKTALEDGVKTAVFACDFALQTLSWLECSHINEAVKKLKYWAEHDPKKWSELNTRARVLRDTITTELKDYLFYQYPKERGRKFVNWKDEWCASIKAFPAIEWDVYEATDCYALQHNTASVFHSMRVAEIGLRALAKERQISLPKNKPIEWATWQEVLKVLD
jgi:hypothetical protein